MQFSDIDKIQILVEIDGKIHQVLASVEIKKAALIMVANDTPKGLTLTEEITSLKFGERIP